MNLGEEELKENLLNDVEGEFYVSEKPLWNPKYLLVMGMLFSYIPVSIFSILNFNRMKEIKKRNIAIFVTIVSSLILTVGLSYIEGETTGKIFALVIVYSVAYYLQHSQIELYKKHIKHGGKKANHFLPSLVSLIFTAFIVFEIITANSNESTVSLSTYNKYDDVIYYDNLVTLEKTEEIGDYFEDIGIFADDDDPWEVSFTRDGDVYTLTMRFFKETIENPDFIAEIEYMQEQIKGTVFTNGETLKINLCNSELEVLKVIE